MACRLYLAPGSLRTGPLRVGGADYHYLVRVRRLRAGDDIVLFDGAGWEAAARIVEVASQDALLEVASLRAAPPASRPSLTFLISLIKGDRTDWALQKLTELGVDRIVPVVAERSVVRPGKRAAARHARYLAIVRAAAQQCGRADVPDVAPIQPLAEAVAAVPAAALRLVLWERAGDSLRSILDRAASDAVAVLVGPEGSLTEGELALTTAVGWIPARLGQRILRAETAAIAAAAALDYALEASAERGR
jgi:16S rRNA (uracil1498-N3)-methyltransferase